jgi:hypothetical protein
MSKIRLLAIRRIGEISRDLETSKGGRPNNSSERSEELSKQSQEFLCFIGILKGPEPASSSRLRDRHLMKFFAFDRDPA